MSVSFVIMNVLPWKLFNLTIFIPIFGMAGRERIERDIVRIELPCFTYSETGFSNK